MSVALEKAEAAAYNAENRIYSNRDVLFSITANKSRDSLLFKNYLHWAGTCTKPSLQTPKNLLRNNKIRGQRCANQEPFLHVDHFTPARRLLPPLPSQSPSPRLHNHPKELSPAKLLPSYSWQGISKQPKNFWAAQFLWDTTKSLLIPKLWLFLYPEKVLVVSFSLWNLPGFPKGV